MLIIASFLTVYQVDCLPHHLITGTLSIFNWRALCKGDNNMKGDYCDWSKILQQAPVSNTFQNNLFKNSFTSFTIYEPRHDKTNKMTVRPAKTQISLGIYPVWSESSLSAWRNLGSLATHWAHSEDSDQTGRMPRLIWVFAGRTLTLLVLSCRGSYGEVLITDAVSLFCHLYLTNATHTHCSFVYSVNPVV